MTTEAPRLDLGPEAPAGYTLEERTTNLVERNGRRRPVTYWVAVRHHGTPETGIASVRSGHMAIADGGLIVVDYYHRDAPADAPQPADVERAAELGVSLGEYRRGRPGSGP